MKPIISHFQAKQLVQQFKEKLSKTACSLDLSITQIEVELSKEGVKFSESDFLNWKQIKKIIKNENNCFFINDNELEKIKGFSEKTHRAYSLFPTISAPSIIIAGFVMHRIKNSDPITDTLKKIEAVGKISGKVLDTATGLGYTAIYALKHARSIDTIEFDPMSIEMARLNPWSQELFSNSKIRQHIGDSGELIKIFKDQSFDIIIHDPPSISLATHLYSTNFYKEVNRVLKKTGKLFHYIGNPNSQLGKKVTTNVIKHLKSVGFSHIERKPEAFGVLAKK